MRPCGWYLDGDPCHSEAHGNDRASIGTDGDNGTHAHGGADYGAGGIGTVPADV